MKQHPGKWLLVVLAGLGATNLTAESSKALTDFSASYELTYKMLSGRLEIDLSQSGQDGEFIYTVTTLPGIIGSLLISGDAVETACFKYTDGELQPLYYRLDDGMEAADSETEIQFDWENAYAVATHEGNTLRIPIKNGVVDRLSADIIAMQRLRNGKTPGKFNIVDEDSVSTYAFRQLGEERLSVPAGTFETIKFRRKRKGSKRSVIVWFAPETGYLPVKFEYQKNGKKTFSAAAISLSSLND